MIGDASVVALSEAAHGAAEPLEFRNRVLRYLVEKKGFNTIAIESGMVESRLVHDYVRGRGGELASVLEQGISWGFDRFPQNRDLIQWLREHNTRSRPVNFYGFDVPGSPGSTEAKRGADTALMEVLRYLDRIDPRSPQVSSTEDYEWAVRAAVGALQIDQWLRLFHANSVTEALDIRDRAQFDNLCWIVGREGPGCKILVHASRFHLSTATFSTPFGPQQPAGTYLRKHFGAKLVTIGNLIGRGESHEGKIAPAAPDTLDGLAGSLGKTRFLLDLRAAASTVTNRLAQEHPLGAGQEGCSLAPGRAFDVLWYIDAVSRA